MFALASMLSPLIGTFTLVHQTLDGRADARKVAFCFRHLMWDVIIIDCLFYTLCNNVPIAIDKPVNMIRLEIRSAKRSRINEISGHQNQLCDTAVFSAVVSEDT